MPLVGQQGGHLVELLEVAPGDRRVHLDGQIQFAGIREHDQRPLRTAFPATKRVVRLGVGAVEADSQAPNAGFAPARTPRAWPAAWRTE